MSDINKLTAFDFHHRIEQQSGISLVLFTSVACSSCRAWKRLLLELQRQRPGINVFEVDAQQDMALVNEFEVFHLPAIFLYRDGQYHAPVQVEASLIQLQQKMDELLCQPKMEMP